MIANETPCVNAREHNCLLVLEVSTFFNAFLKAKTATQTPIEWDAISKGSDQERGVTIDADMNSTLNAANERQIMHGMLHLLVIAAP